MADKTGNQSWNPLNYSQNLCVMSNTAVNTTIGSNTSSSEPLHDSFSSLDIQNNSNDGISRLVKDLMANNDNDLRFDCFPNMQTMNARESNHSFIGDNLSNKSMDNVLNCGDFGLNANSGSLSTASALMAANTNQSLPFKANVMSIPSSSYTDMKPFGQSMRPMNPSLQQMSNSLNRSTNMSSDLLNNALIDPSFHKMSKTLTKPMTNQMNPSFSMNQMNSNQSVMQSMLGTKPQPLPYSQNHTYQQLASLMDQSVQEVNYAANRQMRSIRSRNAVNNCVEPTAKLNYYLDKTYDQFRHLEKERKKIECELIQAFVGKKISSANNFPIQRLPQNASKIDRIIVDMTREHAKVVTIVAKMEQLKDRELSEDIHNWVQKWVDIIRVLQMKRKVEMQRSSTTGMAADDTCVDEICDALKNLWTTIRAVRTALWCSSVLTLYDTTFSSN
ncbi:unnamed protein product [Medioppia subpectinata]|uniref:Uncharacterized protein n=1 Tax=Medioppia subpectinata TaxID=1979941 RepID=A0A7R9KF62_9ACAR|nr:unnamed protein product [Medioppia subpectinata]CAG2102194.1 unnamed protein product [Medioppia subpectinata]